VLHARTLARLAQFGFVVVGTVSILGGAGLEGCSSKSSGSSGNQADASGSGDGAIAYGITPDTGADGSTIFAGTGPVDFPEDASSCPGTACSSLTITDAPVIEEQVASGSVPAFSGGTLADGTYYLTSIMVYGGSVVSDQPESVDASGEDAGGEDASSDAASTGDGATAISDAATVVADASTTDAQTSTSTSDGAVSDGSSSVATADAGVPNGNGNFVEQVISVSAAGTIIQMGTASGAGCTLGTVHVTPSGSTLRMALACGNPFSPGENMSMEWSYTATASTIAFGVPLAGGATAVLTLTLQP
jgi:hypothetical protein